MKWGSSDLLNGKVALVTGGGQGIGGATVDALVDWGAHVMIADLDQSKIDKKIAQHGDRVAGFCVDLTADGAAEELVDATASRFGALDIVVNNAGYSWDSSIVKMTDEQFTAMMNIHVEVPFKVMRAAAQRMIPIAKEELSQGQITQRKFVNVASGAYGGLAGASNYASAKAGVIGLTKSAAKEWGRYNFNVNSVAFGAIFTRMGAASGEENFIEVDGKRIPIGIDPAHLKRLGMELPDAKEIENSITISTPMAVVPLGGRTGTMEEAAASILFLCSPLADYVHGQTLVVSGGITGFMS